MIGPAHGPISARVSYSIVARYITECVAGVLPNAFIYRLPFQQETSLFDD